MPAAVLQQLGVLGHLTLAQRLEAGADGLGDAHAAHHEAEGDAEVLLDGHARQLQCGGDREAARWGFGHAVILGAGGGLAGPWSYDRPARVKNSARDRPSARSVPSIVEDTVVDPAACTPRSVMQVCSAWMTTPTPVGCNCSVSQSAICLVRRSCTWGRRVARSLPAWPAASRWSRSSPILDLITPTDLGLIF